MSSHNYSPEQALELLLRKLGERDEQLVRQIQAAIDSGKDVQERDSAGRRRKSRVYRKTVRFTEEEALHVAIDALQACFVEQPLFVNSADKNFRPAALGNAPRRSWPIPTSESQVLHDEGVSSKKELEIEIQTETQISKGDQQTLRLEPVSEEMVLQQKRNLDNLHALTTFESE